MKKISTGLLFSLITLSLYAQDNKTPLEKTLLWKISGHNIETPSYLYGTIHMLCKEDAELSDSLTYVIENVDAVYFEVDMDNLFEMFGMVRQMKMLNDTTWADLYSPEDYQKVKSYFKQKKMLLPFSTMETYKPFLAASLLMEGSNHCETSVAMEQVIMSEAKKNRKQIKGLETMASQLAIFDKIPYQLQADQLLEYINNELEGNNENSNAELLQLMEAWQSQDLDLLEELTIKSDIGLSNFTDILLFDRNKKWVASLQKLLGEKSLLVAVGAGHLPGELGVINLLRKAGYQVTPVKNVTFKTREI